MVNRLAGFLFLAIALAGPLRADEPPATVVVTFDRQHQRTVIAEGLADPASRRAVTAHDPVRIASISKLVTALVALRLADRGRIDLDRDVSAYLGWSLRHPGFPDRPITLAMLLSHRAGLSDRADYVIPLGETVQGKLADPRAWDMDHAPESGWFGYANLDFPVAASVMEAATSTRFDRLARGEVLAPLGLSACFNWSSCPPGTTARAVVLRDGAGKVLRDDLHGRPPPCPVVPAADGSCDLARYRPGDNGGLFSPQGGLRISMADLARIGRMLARGGRGFLSREGFDRLVSPAWQLDGGNGTGEDGAADGMFCAYGLALQRIGTPRPGCHDDLFGDGVERIGHPGEAYGLRSGLWVDPASGRGIAYFTTEVADGAPAGRSAFSHVEEALVRRAIRATARGARAAGAPGAPRAPAP